MRKILFKRVKRQPIRSLLLALLVGFAFFLLISRITEYIVISAETERIGGFYRSVGFLFSQTEFGSVAGGADYILQSPYLDFEDRREWVVATWADMDNIQINQLYPQFFQLPPTLRNDAIFTGTIQSTRTFTYNGVDEFLNIIFEVTYIYSGYSEHVNIGEKVQVRWLINEETLPLQNALIDGQSYLIRAMFYDLYTHMGIHDFVDILSGQSALLTLWPIDADDPFDMTSGEVWFVLEEDLPAGDWLGLPEWFFLKEEIETVNLSKRIQGVMGTVDATAMPQVQTSSDDYFLTAGRWLTHEDDLQKNPVIVLHDYFAQLRNVSIGDRVTLQFYYEGLFQYGIALSPIYISSFEVVGFFDMRSRFQGDSVNFPHAQAYIPLSMIPANSFSQDDFLWEGAYSFVLESPRLQSGFLLENRDTLGEMGFELRFIETGAENFFATADSIRNTIGVNVLVFGFLFLVTVIFAVYLYISQWRKDVAIARSLGCSVMEISFHMLIPIGVLWFVALGLGYYGGWLHAMGPARETLAPLYEAIGVEVDGLSGESLYFPMRLHIMFMTVTLTIVLGLVYVGAFLLSGLPILKQLAQVDAKKEKGYRKREKA